MKDVRADQLVYAIRVIAHGDTLLSPSVTRRLLETFVEPRPPGPEQAHELDVLTQTERKVLVLIGQGRSNTEIAAELFVADTTVRTHVRHIFEKLDLRDRVQAVVLLYSTGLVRPMRPVRGTSEGTPPEESSPGTTTGRPTR